MAEIVFTMLATNLTVFAGLIFRISTADSSGNSEALFSTVFVEDDCDSFGVVSSSAETPTRPPGTQRVEDGSRHID